MEWNYCYMYLRTVVFIPNFGISHTIRQRIAHNRKRIGIRKFFIHFIPKTESVHTPGVISLFFLCVFLFVFFFFFFFCFFCFFFLFFFFCFNNLINFLQLSILVNL